MLVSRLAPYLVAEADRGRHDLALLLARTLERRGDDLPELQRALERALTSESESSAIAAIGYWLAPPRTRGERVAELLEADPSTVTLGSVFRVVAWQRTDLLDVALSRQQPEGRFASDRLRQVQYAPRGAVQRWTAWQREAYLRLVRRVADNAALPKLDRARAVRMIGDIPAVEADQLGRYLRSPDDLLRRAALTALPWSGRPQDVLADLLSYASGDDAHVAVYAATRAVRFVRPADLMASLAPVLAEGKVTARKEAVRLLARHRAPGVTRLLHALWAAEDEHRDVRVAISSAFLQLLDDPESWSHLAEAVAEAGDVAGPVLRTRPLDVPDLWRRPYAGLIVEAARSGDSETRRTAIDALHQWAPYAPEAVDRLADIVCDLTVTADWRTAVQGLVSVVCSGGGGTHLRAVVESLSVARVDHDAGAERDRPAAQRLAEIVANLRRWHDIDAGATAPAIQLVSDVLPTDLEAQILAATMNWGDPRGLLIRLVDRTRGGVLVAAEAGRVLGESTAEVDCDQVLPHAVWLAGENESGALLATGLVAECGPRSGWAAPWRELVRDLRNGGSREVAHMALRIHTAVE
jgi:hypothetical protein